MKTSYGVVWRIGEQQLARGKLELLPRVVRLDGIAGEQRVLLEIPYDDLDGIHTGRARAERLNGHPTLVLEPADGDSISLAAVAQPGVIGELAQRLAELRLDSSGESAVVIPSRHRPH